MRHESCRSVTRDMSTPRQGATNISIEIIGIVCDVESSLALLGCSAIWSYLPVPCADIEPACVDALTEANRILNAVGLDDRRRGSSAQHKRHDAHPPHLQRAPSTLAPRCAPQDAAGPHCGFPCAAKGETKQLFAPTPARTCPRQRTPLRKHWNRPDCSP